MPVQIYTLVLVSSPSKACPLQPGCPRVLLGDLRRHGEQMRRFERLGGGVVSHVLLQREERAREVLLAGFFA